MKLGQVCIQSTSMGWYVVRHVSRTIFTPIAGPFKTFYQARKWRKEHLALKDGAK